MKEEYDLTTTLDVIVPKKHGYMDIDTGSAIVVLRGNEGTHRIYFEGNRYHAENLMSIKGRLQIAASRGLTKAPTTAFMVVTDAILRNSFITIGTYQYSTNTLQVNPLHVTPYLAWLKNDAKKWDQLNVNSIAFSTQQQGVRNGLFRA